MTTKHGLRIALICLLGACATPQAPMAVTPEPPADAPASAPAGFEYDLVQAGTPHVRRWLVLGPFASPAGSPVTPPFIDETRAAPRAGDRAAGHAWVEERSAAASVELGPDQDDGKRATTYAFSYLHAHAETDAVLWLLADNLSRMVLDGRVIHDDRLRDRNFDSGFCVPVHLGAGVHRLLIRVENTGGWHGFRLRIADAAGAPVRSVVPSVAPDDDHLAAAAMANATGFAPAELLALLPTDPELRIAFDSPADLMRLATTEGGEACPRWHDTGGPEYGPSPGRRGALLLHPHEAGPQRAYWKVRVPQQPSALRLVVSAEAFAAPGEADAVVLASLFDGEMRRLGEQVIASPGVPSPEGWNTITIPLPATSLGREALIVLEAADGGRRSWYYEGLWFDEVAVVPAK